MATKDEISFHYDVDTSFYEIFLDRLHRAYSCGVWQNASSLEEAQTAKLARLARFAGVAEGKTLLDIGCGWGGMMKYAVDILGVSEACGLTLSEDQYRFIKSKNRPEMHVHLKSWADFSCEERFDSLISIGAFEHFASLEDRNKGQHRRVYNHFFDWCRSVSKDNARLGLQTIVTSRPPSNLRELRDTRYLLNNVFPGSALPTVSDVLASSQDKYEIVDLRQIGEDYARTLMEWRNRLNRNREDIEQRYGEELFAHYDHYFNIAERSFKSGVVNLVQMSLAACHRTYI